ncbi:hypothetical protein Tco_1252433 [Tanacetum coccineum]
MAEGEIDNLTIEQYLALTRGNQASGVVKPEIGGGVNFEIKSQFMRELREDTFSGNKNDDAHEHVERVLDIVSLFNIPRVLHDAVMLRVFPVTLTGAAKRWVDKLPPRTVDSWDLLKKAFIQRYCPPSKTGKQLEEIHNFKQEGDETLYQVWERYNDLLGYKCPTHDINIHQKVNIFYNGFGTMKRQLLDSEWPIPGMTPAQALTTVQTMAGHSQKWHDGTSSKNIESSSNSGGIAAIVSKLDNLGRDMKKFTENVHAIQVGCQNCVGAHLDKDCPLNEEVKSIEEAKYDAKLGGSYEQTPGGINAKKSQDGRMDLGANVNVIPKSMFEHLNLAQLKKTDMLVEMEDMTKRSPIGIVENVLVKIDKFLFPSDFVVMDMLNTCNETMILGRPFLATIHAEIDVFNKEISLGIAGDRVTFDMNKKIHNFTTPIGEIYMINSTSNNEYTFHTSSDASSRVEKTVDLHNYYDQEQGRSCKKPRKLKFDINQILKGELKFWPTCDPNIRECNGGPKIYGMDEEGVIKKWYCYHDDDRKRINGGGLSFPEFLLVNYGET